MERRLAAILHADVQGYSRLISEDEPATLRLLSSHLELMSTLVRQHGGRAVGSRGDSLLAEFPSVVEAVQCAVEMQRELKLRNAEFPAERQVAFRIGINLGEIVVEGGQLHGEGINTAVRIEGLAAAGGICISEIVYDQIKSRLPVACEDLGEHALKNIAKPVRVYRIVLEEAERPRATIYSPQSKRDTPRPRRVGTAHFVWAGMAGLALLAGVLVTVYYFARPPLSTQHSSLRRRSLRPCRYPTSLPSSCYPLSTSVAI